MDGNLIRQVYEPIATDTVTVPSAQHRTQHIVAQKSMPPPIQPRESNMRYVWGEINNISNNNNEENNKNKENSKTLIMAFETAQIKYNREKRAPKSISKRMSSLMLRLSKTLSSVHPTSNWEEEQSLGVAQLEAKGVWVITPLAQNLCEVTHVLNFVDKGKIPTSLVNASIGRALNPVTFLKAFYERNGLVVDAELRTEFVKNVPRTVNSITAEQQSFVQEEIDSIDYKDDTGWEKLDKESSVFVKLSMKQKNGESNSWGKATTTIDTSAENALAWIWDYCSNERLNAVNKLHKNPREVIKHIAPNQNVFSSIRTMPWPLNARQFVNENTWTKQDDDTYVYAFRPPTTHKFDNRLVDIGKHKAKALVQGESRGFVILKNVGDQKCDLTYVLHADAKGNLPAKEMVEQTPRSLGLVTQLREKFNRDDEIDQEERNELMGVMKNDNENEVYSEEENEMVARITKKMENVKDGLFIPLNSPDFRTKVSGQFVHFFDFQ